jgi:uncharacterized damage-inducible protein DinB
MSLSQLLVNEFDRESASTRKLLECFPDEHADWKPHEKSMTLGRLASHVAELPKFLAWIAENSEFDVQAQTAPRPMFKTKAELMAFFEDRLAEGRAALEQVSDEAMKEIWTFRSGEHIVSQVPRYDALRSWMMNHQIHHRGQLSVYLRLLDIPIPGMYGPSADDILARQAAAAATQAN